MKFIANTNIGQLGRKLFPRQYTFLFAFIYLFIFWMRYQQMSSNDWWEIIKISQGWKVIILIFIVSFSLFFIFTIYQNSLHPSSELVIWLLVPTFFCNKQIIIKWQYCWCSILTWSEQLERSNFINYWIAYWLFTVSVNNQ